jgi:DNA-damage-inducible protein D
MARDVTRTAAFRHTIKALEEVKRITPQGVDFWMAREIVGVLGYSAWENFENVIKKAEASFEASNEDSSHHILETKVMMGVGKGAMREVRDHYLDRAACYLIAMNGDPTKPEIAAAQRYFAIQTRRMEQSEQLAKDSERCELRDKATEAFKRLSGTAQDAGVRSHMQGVFHDAGYRGMYDMPRRDVLEAKGLRPGDNLFDFAGTLELAANTFRMELADNVINGERVRGERAAIQKHESVGKEVRETILRSKGTLPEALPIEPHIKEVHKRLAPAKKQIAKS